MRSVILASVALASLSIAGCGGDNSQATIDPEYMVSGGEGMASAAEVAGNARGDVKCPPVLATPARAAGLPVDDIVGVRPGQTYDEAVNIVLCDNPMLVVDEETYRDFQIETFGQSYRKGFNAKFAEREKSSQEILDEMQQDFQRRSANAIQQDMKPGMVRWYAATIGTSGQERVLHIAREEWYPDSKNPTVDSIGQALIAKYGPTSGDQTQSTGSRDLIWKYDTQNQLITAGSQLDSQCHLQAGPDAGASVNTECGVIVSARIVAMRDNGALAESLKVGSVNSAAGYKALIDTEAAFKAADDARKAQELNDAQQNSAAPKL